MKPNNSAEREGTQMSRPNLNIYGRRISKAVVAPKKCKFCGDRKPLNEHQYCKVCVEGMERTNGD